ncbi:MAG: tRNA pseudouridine(38-40) synthase TruA [Clostridium sp.]|nr:tRNA pseudouridine(38-40) synthase TruA [Clostridium sp.]
MANYRIVLQYEGTRYQGWQKQGNTENTIQGKLEAVLSKMTGQKIEVFGSGRTDAGVHALGQAANFHINSEGKKMDPSEIMDRMNLYLPEDIAVVSIAEASERFHSRLNAKGKTYCYRVINSDVPHVFDRKFAHTIEEELDVKAMEKALPYLMGTHDFKAFTSSKKSKKSTIRTIDTIRIERTGSASFGARQDEIRFWYSGNGFLFHMVRIMTGTLLEVGLHKRKPEDIAEILTLGLRENAGELVPAKGLTLMEVRYQ